MKCNVRPYEGNEPYIFFSYCHENAWQNYPIIEQMAYDGYRIWYDDGLHPGDEWPERIAQMLDGCAICMVALSQKFSESHNCKNELTFAINNHKALLVIKLEDFPMSIGMRLQLSNTQYIEKYQYTSESSFFEKLYSTRLKKLEECKGRPDHSIVINKSLTAEVRRTAVPPLYSLPVNISEPESPVPDVSVSEPEPSVSDVPVSEPEPSVSDVPDSEPEPPVSDVPDSEPELSIPDVRLPGPEPDMRISDIHEPEPDMWVSDIHEPEPDMRVSDIHEPEPDMPEPDVPEPEPEQSIPDAPEPEPEQPIPDAPEPEPEQPIPDAPVPEPDMNKACSPIVVQCSSGRFFKGSYPLTSIGRDKNKCEISFPENHTIGRHHIDIIVHEKKYYIVDRASVNHTWIDGKRLEKGSRCEIGSFGEVKIANETLVVAFGEAAKLLMEHKLLVRLQSEATKESRYLLTERFVLGRGHAWPGGVLSKRHISRTHAIFRISEKGCMLSDVSTYNQTWVNQRRIPAKEEYRLADKDVIRIGGQGGEYFTVYMKTLEEAEI